MTRKARKGLALVLIFGIGLACASAVVRIEPKQPWLWRLFVAKQLKRVVYEPGELPYLKNDQRRVAVIEADESGAVVQGCGPDSSTTEYMAGGIVTFTDGSSVVVKPLKVVGVTHGRTTVSDGR